MRRRAQLCEIFEENTGEPEEAPGTIAERILQKLENFEHPPLDAPLPPRVQTGNEIYKRMCQVRSHPHDNLAYTTDGLWLTDYSMAGSPACTPFASSGAGLHRHRP